MLNAEIEQVHAIAKFEIAAANVELENKIKKLESDIKDLKAKSKRETPAIKEVKKNG